MRLDRTEARLLGALIEKGWTTPEQYPLTLKALVAACNQKSNRHPVAHLSPLELEGSLLRLRPRGLIRQHERDSGRVPRFEGLLGKDLGLRRQEEAIIAELLLRGPQTAPELARRCSRMATFAGPSEVEALLGGLAHRELVRLLPRESGQRHARWAELLTDAADALPAAESVPVAEPTSRPAEPHTGTAAPIAPAAAPPAPAPAPPAAPARDEEVEALRNDVEALRGEVAELRTRLDELAGM